MTETKATKRNVLLMPLLSVGLVLLFTGGVLAWVSLDAKQAYDRERFWRKMYLGAEHDAKFKNCLDLDDLHVVCEKQESK